MTEPFHVAICEDNRIYGDWVEETVEIYMKQTNRKCEIVRLHSGVDLVRACEQEQLPEIQLLILDVEMEPMNGIAVKDFLANRTEVKAILFLTGYREYMPDAFGRNVVGFLEKTIQPEKVEYWIDVAWNDWMKKDVIVFGDGKERKKVEKKDIIYISGQKDYTLLHCVGQKNPHWVHQTLQYWEQLLMKDSIVRVHKSYMVNLDHVAQIRSKDILLKDTSALIPIGRTYCKKVKAKYAAYDLKQL